MARNFLSLPSAPYNGVYSSKAFNTGRGQQKGEMVPVDILWGSYQANGASLGSANPNFAVAVNLNTAGPSTVSGTWTPQSVYIDNEGVDFPVYVYFPDTQFSVSAPANAAGWYEVYTLARQALVCGLGIDDNAVTQAQRTRVFFTDVAMVPSLDQEQQSAIDLWIGSDTIQRENLPLSGYGAPALGDQTFSGQITLLGNSVINLASMTTTAKQSLYVTEFKLYATGIIGTGQLVIFFENSIDGPVYSAEVFGNATYPINGVVNGFVGNVKYGASRTFTLNSTLAAGAFGNGVLNYSFTFTKSSN